MSKYEVAKSYDDGERYELPNGLEVVISWGYAVDNNSGLHNAFNTPFLVTVDSKPYCGFDITKKGRIPFFQDEIWNKEFMESYSTVVESILDELVFLPADRAFIQRRGLN